MRAAAALPLLTLPLLALALAACGSEPEPTPEPTATTTASGPRTLVPTNLALDELGPRVVGPEGPEVESAITQEGREIGTMTSFVTCPAETGAEICDPAVQPEGTVYTYVHHITLNETAGGEEPVNAALFRTMRAVPGFANVIGYDEDEVTAALGEGGEIKVQVDNGALIWRVAAGDGWSSGETLTFYWRSTAPPEGPARAFELEAGGMPAVASGPFPAEAEPVEE